jgi:hypothetical protein
MKRPPQGRRNGAVAGLQQIEEGRADEILGIAAVEVLSGAGDEGDDAVDRHLDEEVGRGESEADEPVALAANGPEYRVCGVQWHGSDSHSRPLAPAANRWQYRPN